MFVLFQVPIADSRGFIDEGNKYRIPSPLWPLPHSKPEDEKEDFVRSFGATKKRWQGGPEDWAAEEYYCNAKQGIRFEPSLGKRLLGTQKKIRLNCTFRRLFCDQNRIVSRFELGFTRAERWYSRQNRFLNDFYRTSLNADEVHQIISDILALPVHISRNQVLSTQTSEQKICRLQEIGSFLAEKYLHSTTSHQGHQSGILEKNKWWVTRGTPMLLIELEACCTEDLFTDKRFKYEIHVPEAISEATKIDIGNSEGIQLWYLRETPKSQSNGTIPIDVWILLYDRSVLNDRDKKRKFREIRLHLSRLTAERGCLKVILQQILGHQIQVQRNTPESDLLQKYISESISRLSKETYYGILQRPLLKKLQEYDALLHPGEYTNLLAALDSIRGNYLKNIATFIKNPHEVSN